MFDSPTFLIVIGVVLGVVGYSRVRRAKHLEAKLRALRVVLITFGAAFVIDMVAIVIHMGDRPRPGATSGEGLSSLTAHLDALQAHGRDSDLLVTGLVVQIAFALPSVIHTLGELARFVLAHRSDLAARDMAAAFRVDQPAPV